MTQPDFIIHGTFDNAATNQREVWRDGRMCRFVRRNAVGTHESTWLETWKAWGSYPDIPQIREILA